MPPATENLVTNTGPLIALGRIGAFDLVGQLPIRFVAPREVADEITAGAKLGHPVAVPEWIEIVGLTAPLSAVSASALDRGPFRLGQNRCRVDAPSKPQDRNAARKISLGTPTVNIQTEYERRQARLAKAGKLRGHVFRRPESENL